MQNTLRWVLAIVFALAWAAYRDVNVTSITDRAVILSLMIVTVSVYSLGRRPYMPEFFIGRYQIDVYAGHTASAFLLFAVCLWNYWSEVPSSIFWAAWAFAGWWAAVTSLTVVAVIRRPKEVISTFTADNRDELNRLRAKLKKVSK